MAKKTKAKKAKTVKTARAKKGDKYVCNECGAIISVENVCDCSGCDITCCGTSVQPMSC